MLVVVVQGPDSADLGWELVVMRATIDMGAELNLVSYDWCPLLQATGGTFVPLAAPTRVSWLNNQS